MPSFLVNLFYPAKRNYQDLIEELYDELDSDLRSYREVSCKASLEKIDAMLQFSYEMRGGFHKFFTFENENQLDQFLSKKEKEITLWEIQDNRNNHFSPIIYKYLDDIEEKVLTFLNKDELYKEISSTTDQGIFCVYDLKEQTEIFILQKKRFLKYDFQELSLKKAKKHFVDRDLRQANWRKIYALGIAFFVFYPISYR